MFLFDQVSEISSNQRPGRTTSIVIPYCVGRREVVLIVKCKNYVNSLFVLDNLLTLSYLYLTTVACVNSPKKEGWHSVLDNFARSNPRWYPIWDGGRTAFLSCVDRYGPSQWKGILATFKRQWMIEKDVKSRRTYTVCGNLQKEKSYEE